MHAHCPFSIIGTSKKVSLVGKVNYFRFWPNLVGWISSKSTLVVIPTMVCANFCSFLLLFAPFCSFLLLVAPCCSFCSFLLLFAPFCSFLLYGSQFPRYGGYNFCHAFQKWKLCPQNRASRPPSDHDWHKQFHVRSLRQVPLLADLIHRMYRWLRE